MSRSYQKNIYNAIENHLDEINISQIEKNGKIQDNKILLNRGLK
ncbi:hypothetical protein [Bacillus sp. OK048]|nr:hypothetical protein [Bacillus sp. OK048]SDN44230.1 hypothetical protein SAMN05443253_1129 [Bacillus sp. OK048]